MAHPRIPSSPSVLRSLMLTQRVQKIDHCFLCSHKSDRFLFLQSEAYPQPFSTCRDPSTLFGSMSRFCGDCGTPAAVDDGFCSECGSKLDPLPVESAPAPAAAPSASGGVKPTCASCNQTIESGEVIDDGSNRYIISIVLDADLFGVMEPSASVSASSNSVCWSPCCGD